jgi:hypothetical protein
MSTFIKPTVGRVVLLMLGTAAPLGFAKPGDGLPCAAVIAHVHGDRCINVAAFDANGVPRGFTSVTLLQGDDVAPEGVMHAKWMDYQKGQAAKAEQLEAKLATAPGLQPHQQRVVAEKAELDERLAKLRGFLTGDVIKTLGEAEQMRLTTQASCMQEYSDILAERIAAFA